MANVNAKIQDFLANNRKFVETYQVPPTMDQIMPGARSAGGGILIRASSPLRTLSQLVVIIIIIINTNP